MAFYDKFPYTNFQEINLDRLIQEIIKVKEGLDFVIENSSLKYADPIQWNITSQYQTNTVVIDPATGIAYISTQPVPINVQITNTGYWTPIFDLSALFNNLETDIQNVNNDLQNVDNDLQNYKTTVNGSLLALDGRITPLETAVNTTLPGRIDAADQAISDLDNRTDTLEGTVAQHTTNINTLNSVMATKAESWLANKHCAIFGDSLSNMGDGINGTMWQYVKQSVPSVTLYDYAVGGATISDISGQIANQQLTNIDVVFINCGTNDWQVGTPLSTFDGTLSGCIDSIRTKNRSCEIILIAMPYSYHADFANGGQRNGINADVRDYTSFTTMVGLYKSVPTINLYATGECQANNYQYMLDPSTATIYVHPNAVFSELIARKIVNRDFNSTVYPIGRTIVPNTGVTADVEVIYHPLTHSIRLKGSVTSPSTISGAQTITIGSLPMPSGLANLTDFRIPVMNYTTGSTQCYLFYAGNVLALGGTLSAGNVIVCNN